MEYPPELLTPAPEMGIEDGAEEGVEGEIDDEAEDEAGAAPAPGLAYPPDVV